MNVNELQRICRAPAALHMWSHGVAHTPRFSCSKQTFHHLSNVCRLQAGSESSPTEDLAGGGVALLNARGTRRCDGAESFIVNYLHNGGACHSCHTLSLHTAAYVYVCVSMLAYIDMVCLAVLAAQGKHFLLLPGSYMGQ